MVHRAHLAVDVLGHGHQEFVPRTGALQERQLDAMAEHERRGVVDGDRADRTVDFDDDVIDAVHGPDSTRNLAHAHMRRVTVHICGALGGAWRSFLLLEYFVAEVHDIVLGTVDDDAAAIFLDDDLAVL